MLLAPGVGPSRHWALSRDGINRMKAEELARLESMAVPVTNSLPHLLRKGHLQEDARNFEAALASYGQAVQVLESPSNQWSTDLGLVLRRRARIHETLGHVAEGRADLLRACNIPPRDPGVSRQLVDLTDYFNAGFDEDRLNSTVTGNNLATLEKGVRTFADVSFDLRGIVQLTSPKLALSRSEYPQAVNHIRAGQKARRLRFLHGTAFSTAAGTEIARYVIHFADDRTVSLPLVYGRDLLDWWKRPLDDRLATLAWEGRNSRSLVQLFMFTWINPNPEEEIRDIDFIAAGTDAAPFLLSITVE